MKKLYLRAVLIGMDTPESSYNFHIEKQRSLGDTKTILALGKRAKKFTQSLAPPGTEVRLEFDVQVKDPFERTLAYVWLPDGRMLNEVLVEEGYAMASTYPPNTRYEERFRKAYRYAVENYKGLWGGSASQAQVTSTSNKTSFSAKSSCPADKPIKGNVSSKGEKIYHLPSGVYYKRTEPENCFTTEEEAQKEGFRRSSR